MSCAAAKIPPERLFDLVDRGMGCLTEEGLAFHDHSVSAIAALSSLFLDERSLNTIRLIRSSQAFDCRNRMTLGLFDRKAARPDCLAVHQDGARSALSQAAAELRAMQSHGVSKYI